MFEVIPAIMPQTLSDLREHLERVRGVAQVVQIDVMDGVFVPEKTWPYRDADETSLEVLKDEDFSFEIDLMVSNPEEVVLLWVAAGARRIIVHIESVHDREALLGGKKDAELGIAINIETPDDALEPFLPYISFVQCMGIRRIGYQGEPFDARVIERIKRLREKYPALILSVDGGVSAESISLLRAAGVHRVAVGSAIFKSTNVQDTIASLSK